MSGLCRYKLNNTSTRNIECLNEWKVEFVDNCYTKATLNTKTLSAKGETSCNIKAKHNVNTFTCQEDRNCQKSMSN